LVTVGGAGTTTVAPGGNAALVSTISGRITCD
jgi:hypothetical protein